MEDLWSKYDKIKEVFYRDFVYDSSYTEQASCIPLSSVKNGAGWVGDGTINLAQYLQFLYTEIILGNKTEDDVRNAILVLTRLADTTYDLFFNNNKGSMLLPIHFTRSDLESGSYISFLVRKRI